MMKPSAKPPRLRALADPVVETEGRARQHECAGEQVRRPVDVGEAGLEVRGVERLERRNLLGDSERLRCGSRQCRLCGRQRQAAVAVVRARQGVEHRGGKLGVVDRMSGHGRYDHRPAADDPKRRVACLDLDLLELPGERPAQHRDVEVRLQPTVAVRSHAQRRAHRDRADRDGPPGDGQRHGGRHRRVAELGDRPVHLVGVDPGLGGGRASSIGPAVER